MGIIDIIISVLMLIFIGSLFALFYLVTDNLFMVIGIHSLMNFSATIYYSNFSFIGGILLMIGIIIYKVLVYQSKLKLNAEHI